MNEEVVKQKTVSKLPKLSRLFGFILLAISQVIAVAVVVYTFLPIAQWYLKYSPLWGIDFFLTADLASVLNGHLVLPYAFWNYGWFGGWPQLTYPFLTIYVLSFISRFWGLIVGAQMMVMGFSILFITGCYFLFYRTSKNIALSTVLAVFTALSGGVYQTLTWAGSLPSYSSQAAFPWFFGFLVWYLKSSKKHYFLASVLIAGISIFIHPLVFMTYITPVAAILIFTHLKYGLIFFKHIKLFVLFVLIALIIGLPQFYSTFGSSIKSLVKTNATSNALSTTKSQGQSDTAKDIVAFNRKQVLRIVGDNHPGLFYMTAVIGVFFILSLIVSRRIVSLVEVLPFICVSIYFVFYIWLFGEGISIYHGGWYRLFWSVPVWLGALGSILWFETFENLRKLIKNRIIHLGLLSVLSLVIIFLGIKFYFGTSMDKVIFSIKYRSEASSAYPDILNLKAKETDRKALKQRLIPKWLNGDDPNWRLYGGDQTVNIWWNTLFKMPLARGYLDPPLDNNNKGYFFWLDSALSEDSGEPQLVHSFKYPLETARSNALFLIDWNAVRYYEGGHTGSSYTPFPKYLSADLVGRQDILDFNDQKYTKRPVTLNYSEIKEEQTSPVMSATNASTIGIFASDSGYETVIRAIAERDNINSQKLIPVKLGKFVDKYDLSTLKSFDSLYLYDYDYKSEKKAFDMLGKYVQGGKKLFIETGVEVKQSAGDLSDFFPVKKVERRGLGKEWALEGSGDAFTRDVILNNFFPSVFDNDEWKLSFADESSLRSGARVILKDHGKIIMASQKLGGGEIFWSGMNFAYHLSRNHNGDEAKLFLNLLNATNDLSKKIVPKYGTSFINANSSTIRFEGAKGVLFKEQAYDGWNAHSIAGQNGKLRIYKVGPAYPGFIYIPLSNTGKGEIMISFGGSLIHKLQVVFSIVLVVLIFEEIVLSGFFLGRIRSFVWKQARTKMAKWWEKEDEE